jgi:hypothetical protein
MTPMLRGENGNPGNFEMFWGEFDDGIAAVEWLASQPNIDRDHIYTFGHSIGGGLSALLSLADESVPIRHGGSYGGLYPAEIFHEWKTTCPFDTSDKTECSLRTLQTNTRSMRRKHFGYLGIADPLNSMFRTSGEQLRPQTVPGDHFSGLRPALANYVRIIHKEAFGDSRPLPESVSLVSWKHPRRVPTESVITDAPKPEIWDVEADPLQEPLAYFPGEVRCPVKLITKSSLDHRGDVAFPSGPEPLMQLTEYPPRRDQRGPQHLFDLKSLLATRQSGTAVFEVLRRNVYGYSDDRDHRHFHWPGTRETIRRAPGNVGQIASGCYSVSPGKRYVAGFTMSKKLIVWENRTQQIVGQLGLPELPGFDKEFLSMHESGFAPDGSEFAAVLGTPGNMWLLNWHWKTGNITACYPKVSPGINGPIRQQRFQLQFLEDKQGWLTERGRVIVDRETGQRRNAFAGYVFTYSTPRLISGKRLIAVWQDPADLFHHEIRTLKLGGDR